MPIDVWSRLLKAPKIVWLAAAGLLSAALPWYQVHLLFLTVGRSAYQLPVYQFLVPLAWLAIGALAGWGTPTQQRRVLPWLTTAWAAFLLLTPWLLRVALAHAANQALTGLAGSAAGSLAQAIGALGGPAWGWIVSLGLALGTVALAWQPRRAIPGVADASASDTPLSWNSADWSGLRSAGQRALTLLRQRPRIILGLLAAAAAYGGAVWAYNSHHTPSTVARHLLAAIAAGHARTVASLIVLRDVPPQTLPAFTAYWRQHPNALHALLAPVLVATSSPESAGMVPGEMPTVVPQGFLGFTGYRVALPPARVLLQGPPHLSPTFRLGNTRLASVSTLLPGQYSVTATVHTPWGSVRETRPVNTRFGSTTVVFGFQADDLHVSSPDLPASAALTWTVNGHPVPAAFVQAQPQPLLGGLQATLGPLPHPDGARIQVTAKEPWGPYVESATASSSRDVQLASDAAIQAPLLARLASRLNTFLAAATAASPHLPHALLAPQSPWAQDPTQAVSAFPGSYRSLRMAPQATLITLHGAPGLATKVTGYFRSQGFFFSDTVYETYQFRWTYQDGHWKLWDGASTFFQNPVPQHGALIRTAAS